MAKVRARPQAKPAHGSTTLPPSWQSWNVIVSTESDRPDVKAMTLSYAYLEKREKRFGGRVGLASSRRRLDRAEGNDA